MSLAVVYSRASVGIDAPLVTIEVHLANGLPAFNLVGLAAAAVRESKERVRSALINSGFEFPAKRITVNLAPADLPKEGGRFDLAIAIGIIAACGLLPDTDLSQYEMVGELALTGQIRTVCGALPFNYACTNAKRIALLPLQNADEALLVNNSQVFGVTSLSDLYLHLSGRKRLTPSEHKRVECQHDYQADMADIKGQQLAKRALEISAAGMHNILFCGPPGTGKTMLAKRLMTLLPPMDQQQALQTATIRSVAGQPIDLTKWTQRPFRQPHHTASSIALVGGGSNPKPGEISLAHHGVLFLDELPEFERHVLDVLREPMEAGKISISRAAKHVCFPAQFQLVAAMNPSPTGALHDGRSTSEQVLRYINRISTPFLDRIDLQVDVPKLSSKELFAGNDDQQESSKQIRIRVLGAHQQQYQRANKSNAQLNTQELDTYCVLSSADQRFMQTSMEQLGLSMRSYHRTIKVARTIADLASCQHIQRKHLSEALSYRALDNIIQQLK
ncbi:YifB family Mg chelatase-like AAA ATPase [Aliiglaciecola litoralis]|uniref:YifB family Mg chelatase-like AAA ATPase n=1 Tax=Aliiglaciecola litoralis TaxID=582857 RepID=A0ABN1LF46_9ALTE